MTFGSALSIATSGLTAASARARTIANNIANASTEGYTRRITSLSEQVVGNIGQGVRVLGIDNFEAPFLTADRQRLEANSAFTFTKAQSAAKLSSLLGEPGADNGLFREYALFETSLRDVAATPESAVLQSELLDRGRNLAQTFRSLTAAADVQRTTADRGIASAVAEVNASLQRLQELNSLPSGELTPSVSDERQRLVDRVNQYIPVHAQQTGAGTLGLVTEGGIFLLDVRAQKVDFQPAGTIGRTQTLGSPLSGLSVNGVDITPGGGGPQATQSGEIAALFDVRDSQVPAFQDQIDALAADVINRFADDSVDPTKVAGQSGLFTDGSTTPPGLTNVVGIAGSIQLNALVDPLQGGSAYRIRDGLGATSEGPAGNGDQLNRLLDAFTNARAAPTVLSSSGSRGAAELASEVSSSVAFEDRNSSEAAFFAATRYDIAREFELGATGVDTDQELQKLLLVERAYAANAKVIQTVQQLLNDLLGII